jgi:hypothetical protein
MSKKGRENMLDVIGNKLPSIEGEPLMDVPIVLCNSAGHHSAGELSNVRKIDAQGQGCCGSGDGEIINLLPVI